MCMRPDFTLVDQAFLRVVNKFNGIFNGPGIWPYSFSLTWLTMPAKWLTYQSLLGQLQVPNHAPLARIQQNIWGVKVDRGENLGWNRCALQRRRRSWLKALTRKQAGREVTKKSHSRFSSLLLALAVIHDVIDQKHGHLCVPVVVS